MSGGGSRTEDAIAASDPHAVDPHAAAEPGLAARIRTVLSESAIYLLASLGAAFGAVVNYYLGSSLGSTQKTAMLKGGTNNG